MAHKNTGVKHQDKNPNPHTNENWGEKGFEQGQGQGSSESSYEAREHGYESQQYVRHKNAEQENQKNRGFEEDQPKNPVRDTGSLDPEQQKETYRQPGDDENK